LLSEITGWHQADDPQKLQIIANASARLTLLQQGHTATPSVIMPDVHALKPPSSS
jgi:hypothetical protein